MGIRGWRIDENESDSLFSLNKSEKDDIKTNLRDEIAAVAHYKDAEKNTKKPKLKQMFEHIREEEEEHQKELEDASKGKSPDLDLFRTPKYSTPFSTRAVRSNTGVTKPPSSRPNTAGISSGYKKLYSTINRPMPSYAKPAMAKYDMDMAKQKKPKKPCYKWEVRKDGVRKFGGWEMDLDMSGGTKVGTISSVPAPYKSPTPKPVTVSPAWKKNMGTLKQMNTDADLLGGGGGGMTSGGTGAGVVTIGQGSYPQTRKRLRKRVHKAIHDSAIALGTHLMETAINKAVCPGSKIRSRGEGRGLGIGGGRGPIGRRKHTPIKSEAQRRMFFAIAGGKKGLAPGLSKEEAKRHLEEVSDKKLPEKVKKDKKGKKEAS
jgi:hypothetical protein